MNVTFNGQEYEIVNWPEIRSKFLFALKELIVNRIQDEARKMRLFDTGEYIRDFTARVDEGEGVLVIENPHMKAVYLEWGTMAYAEAYSPDGFPSVPHPKKKDMTANEKAAYPKGMQPFAPVRRVLYNQELMAGLFVKAWGAAA